jgi:hypothetical protein
LFVLDLELRHGAFARRFFSRTLRRAFFLPARASSIVDLPDPLGPMIAIIDPGSAYPAKKDLVFTQQTNLISVLQYMRSQKNLERASERGFFFLQYSG